MEKKIAVIGLGYVGLPLAVEFAKQYPTVGFDINGSRIDELMKGHDRTLEVEGDELKKVITSDLISTEKKKRGLFCTAAVGDIESANFYIVTVPTPIDKNKRPILTPLIKASETVGKVLQKGDYVIYESTVYPGATEDECVPVLELFSGLKFNEDFFVGYSPERINPGDKNRTVTKIVKVTSGSTPEAAVIIDELYTSIITAGTFVAQSIKVAEAAKVIENSQRDINIAFVNELSIIFGRLGIDTLSVLEAASSKWNFLPFKPGLVGGHCIGVDPYYLAQKAQEIGYYPEIILAGRKLNDSMGGYTGDLLVKKMLLKKIEVVNSQCLIMGFTFKENCPDIRNSRVIDIVKTLESYNIDVTIYDPWVDVSQAEKEYSINVTTELPKERFSSIIVAVNHSAFKSIKIQDLADTNSVIFDLKGMYDINSSDFRL